MTMIDDLDAIDVKTRRTWRCPDWCAESDDHERDSESLDNGRGGAVHRSRQWNVCADGWDWSVQLVQDTHPDRPDGDVRVWLADTADQNFSLTDAQRFAFGLLSAVAVAEHGTRL